MPIHMISEVILPRTDYKKKELITDVSPNEPIISPLSITGN